jgi:hypothetical protein
VPDTLAAFTENASEELTDASASADDVIRTKRRNARFTKALFVALRIIPIIHLPLSIENDLKIKTPEEK